VVVVNNLHFFKIHPSVAPAAKKNRLKIGVGFYQQLELGIIFLMQSTVRGRYSAWRNKPGKNATLPWATSNLVALKMTCFSNRPRPGYFWRPPDGIWISNFWPKKFLFVVIRLVVNWRIINYQVHIFGYFWRHVFLVCSLAVTNFQLTSGIENEIFWMNYLR